MATTSSALHIMSIFSSSCRICSRIFRLCRVSAKMSMDLAGPRNVMQRFVNSSTSTRRSPSTSSEANKVQASEALISAVSRKAS